MYPTDKVKTTELKKRGFIRVPEQDFSDDGTRFIMFKYKDVNLSYAYHSDYGHFMDIRYGYGNGPDHRDYMLFPSHKVASEFNGSKDIDLDKLVENCEMAQADMDKWKENPNFARELKQKEENDFRKSLEQKHMVGVENNQILNAVWNQAWEYGHSSGFSEVENFYIDLALLAQDIIQACN